MSARGQEGAGEGGLVHRVGVDLGLKAQAVARGQRRAALAHLGGDEVAAVELHGGSGGADLHGDAGAGADTHKH